MTIGDKELFNAAMSEEPAETPEPEPAPEPKPEPEPKAKAERRPRGERGKPAEKQPEEPAEESQEPPAETDGLIDLAPLDMAAKTKIADQIRQQEEQPEPKREDHRIPLAEHLSVRERAQRAEQERDQERQTREALQRQYDAMQRQIEELRKPKDEPADVWADPQAFIRQQLDPIRSGQEAAIERMSRAMAIDKFGSETVATAMGELERQMIENPQARFDHQRIMASDHPYGELVAWHKRQVALKEIGDDPAAYRQKAIDEALKDPEIVKRVIENARAQAQQASGDKVRPPNIDLPPSLNRTTGSGGQAEGPTAKTDAEIHKELFPQ